MTLADDVEGLLRVLQNDLTAALKTWHAHSYYFSHAASVFPKVTDARLVFDDSRDTEIERAEDYFALNVLYKG